MRGLALCMAGILVVAATVRAQSSSMMSVPLTAPDSSVGAERARPQGASPMFNAVPPRELARATTLAIEKVSLFAVTPTPPRKFKPEDLITISVRQQKKYEADGRLDNKKKWDVDGKLSDWFRFYGNGDVTHLGQDKLTNGEPGFKYSMNNKYKGESTSDREDKFTTRIQARIVDVKPNGTLALEAKIEEQHDEEHFTITLTGVCRSEDVTADNSVLSTQIAELVLVEKNSGAVRDGTKRGWVPKVLDWAGAF